MNQQASDLPRSVQTITRFRGLIGLVTLLGAFGGVIFGALNPPTVSTSQTLVMFTAPTCPAAAICGGPIFSPGYVKAMLLKEYPIGVQVKSGADGVVSISVAAGTAARAEIIAYKAANSFITDTGSISFIGEHASAQVLRPATIATGTTPPKRLAGDALLGAVAGVLLGTIAALAGGQTIIDPPALPRGAGARVGDPGSGQPGAGQPGAGQPRTGWPGAGWPAGNEPRGRTLTQLAQEYAERTPPFGG
jgi:hypothetical protein